MTPREGSSPLTSVLEPGGRSRVGWGPVAGVFAVAIAVVLGARSWLSRPNPRALTVARAEVSDVAAAVIPQGVRDDGPADPGELVRNYSELAQPPGQVTDEDCQTAQSAWLFPEMNQAEMQRQLQVAGFAGGALSGLLSAAQCETNGCTIDAPDTVLMSLPPDPRGRIYRFLGNYNGAMFSAIPFRRPLRFGRWEQLASLSPHVREVLRHTAWVESDTEYFADVAPVCRALGDPAERRQLFEALNRRYPMELSVRISRSTNLDPLVRYWAQARPPEIVRGIFERVLREADGGEGLVNVREFLPTMPRRRLDTFPRREQPPFDCFWTSLRFFDDAAESIEPPGHEGFVAELNTRWEQIPPDRLRFGDMIVLYDHGNPVHAMTHIADDVVFTKNGGSLIRAWHFMSSEDVRRDYVFSTETRVFRRRPR